MTSSLLGKKSTIYDNTAAKSGGISISEIDSNVRANEIDTSIIANNHAPAPNADIAGTTTILYPPDWIQDPSGATFRNARDNTPIDPHKSTFILSGPLRLGPLGNNGGLTATYALNPGSPAIGKISAQDCSDVISINTDQRNMPRPRKQGGTAIWGPMSSREWTYLLAGSGFACGEGNSKPSSVPPALKQQVRR